MHEKYPLLNSLSDGWYIMGVLCDKMVSFDKKFKVVGSFLFIQYLYYFAYMFKKVQLSWKNTLFQTLNTLLGMLGVLYDKLVSMEYKLRAVG